MDRKNSLIKFTLSRSGSKNPSLGEEEKKEDFKDLKVQFIE